MSAALLICRLVLALVLVVAAAGKLLDLAGSRHAAAAFGVPERLARLVGVGLPVVELAVAIALVPRSSAPVAAIAATLLLAAFAAGMARVLAQGERPDCHCFGAVHSAPVSGTAVARNGVLAAVAAFVAVAGPHHGGGAGATGWITGLSGDAAIALVAGIVAAGAIAGLAAFSFALLRQQGRILARLDALEGGAPQPAPAPAGEPRPAIGDRAPDVVLDAAGGEPVSIASLWADRTPVALVFADPGCGPCTALLPEVAAWQREHAGRLTVAAVVSGAPGDQRVAAEEHGLALALRQRGDEASRAYGVRGTPTAVLVTGDGRIAAEPAGGAPAIRALVAEATRAPVTLPPRVGDPAPVIALADLDGREHRLGEAAEHATALLFWNPSCGFCQRMLPDLRAYEARPPAPGAPALVLVSRGTAEVNRGLGLRAPILLDQAGTAMRAYGARGTPVAILLDASGAVAAEPAAGADEVLALLDKEVSVV